MCDVRDRDARARWLYYPLAVARCVHIRTHRVRARTAVCCCDALIVMQAGRALHTFLNVIAETFLTTSTILPVCGGPSINTPSHETNIGRFLRAPQWAGQHWGAVHARRLRRRGAGHQQTGYRPTRSRANFRLRTTLANSGRRTGTGTPAMTAHPRTSIPGGPGGTPLTRSPLNSERPSGTRRSWGSRCSCRWT